MRIGIVQFPGTCDENDSLLAISRVADAEILWHTDTDLRKYDAIVIPGGFSYGDYLRVGAIAKTSSVMSAITEFAQEGGPVLGICNGFQILCETGLLPGALLPNDGMRYVSRQVDIEVVNTQTRWSNRCDQNSILSLPIKHASGRYYAPSKLLSEIEANNQVVFRYRSNPNGSLRGIAGVCNQEGNVVGLMPHPEHAVSELCGGSKDGLKLFDSVLSNRVAV